MTVNQNKLPLWKEASLPAAFPIAAAHLREFSGHTSLGDGGLSIVFMAHLVSFRFFSGIKSDDIVKLGRQLALTALSRVTMTR